MKAFIVTFVFFDRVNESADLQVSEFDTEDRALKYAEELLQNGTATEAGIYFFSQRATVKKTVTYLGLK